MQFHFSLIPVEEITPWRSAQGRPSLSWFGLTDGWFWIEVDGQELFRYTREVQEHWQRLAPGSRPALLPYEGYAVARYWEDLLEMLPAVLDPLPGDLAESVANPERWRSWQDAAHRWQEEAEDEAAWDTFYTAVGWWGQRTWDAGHLTHPPRIWFWRVGDSIHIRWDNRDIIREGVPVWEAREGEAAVPVSDFRVAVESFHARFVTEMASRVDAARVAWSRPDVDIDLDFLEREQKDRSGWLAPALDPWAASVRRAFSWDYVRVAIATIEQAVLQDAKPYHFEAQP